MSPHLNTRHVHVLFAALSELPRYALYPQAKGTSTTLPSINEPTSIHTSSLATGRLLAAVAATARGRDLVAAATAAAGGGGGRGCQEEEEGEEEEGGGLWDRSVGSSPNKQRVRALTGT